MHFSSLYAFLSFIANTLNNHDQDAIDKMTTYTARAQSDNTLSPLYAGLSDLYPDAFGVYEA